MHFVEVLVGSAQYHGKIALTYSTDKELAAGSIVAVPLRKQQALGMVIKPVKQPPFSTKPIKEALALKPLPAQIVQLLDWIAEYYPAPLGVIGKLFLPKSLPKKHLIYSCDMSPLVAQVLPPLTQDQQQALGAVKNKGIHVLHGETGSGKTRIYIELARQALDKKQSAIILTPEIGLTSQLVNAFKQSFGNQVMLIHSQLTESARQKAWVRTLESQEPLIVLGPRSALFSPLKQIGLVVVDEAHETAYKQEQAPHYQTSRVAAKLGQLHNCPVILGSATPLVSDYFLAEQKNCPIIRMQKLATGNQDHATSLEIVDLKDRTKYSRRVFLSDALLSAIETTLTKNEQILLFLNRRGTARVIFCEQCGWQASCPQCDVPLVYHADNHTIRCHTCGYRTAAVTNCPDCKNTSIIFRNIGTKAITEEIKTLFPQANVKRFDTDNKKNDRIEQQYESVKNGDIDIIVGTQTLAKGLDLPKLGLVGVIIADTSLYVPDFNAEERTYQLLAQVIGRIGRGHRSSKAIIQTYSPNSSLLAAIMQKDWQTFYQKELAARKAFLFPPFCYILKLACRRVSPDAAEKAAERLASQLKAAGRRIMVEGPTPSFHERIAGKYQWQLIIKAKQRSELLAIIHQLPSNWSYDIDPINLL